MLTKRVTEIKTYKRPRRRVINGSICVAAKFPVTALTPLWLTSLAAHQACICTGKNVSGTAAHMLLARRVDRSRPMIGKFTGRPLCSD